MERNDRTRRAADLLLDGATMLKIACPNCNDPIYRKKDQTMYCATCEKRVMFENEGEESLQQNVELEKDHNDPIQDKIDKLGKQLEQEDDPDKILKIAETIKKLQKMQET